MNPHGANQHSPHPLQKIVDATLMQHSGSRDAFDALCQTHPDLKLSYVCVRRKHLVKKGILERSRPGGNRAISEKEKGELAVMFRAGMTIKEIRKHSTRHPKTLRELRKQILSGSKRKSSRAPVPGCPALVDAIAQHHPDAATRFTMPAERSSGTPMTAYQIAAQLPWLRWAA